MASTQMNVGFLACIIKAISVQPCLTKVLRTLEEENKSSGCLSRVSQRGELPVCQLPILVPPT